MQTFLYMAMSILLQLYGHARQVSKNGANCQAGSCGGIGITGVWSGWLYQRTTVLTAVWAKRGLRHNDY